ncbi:hypothetical protein [Microbulbifer sp. ARAS458-1]|uniref:hypothetical protein n=1 Tax=Microbulbifer sp. ARAS458-1 TaxID=3140242 RepID=UPI0038779C2B
MFQHDMYRRVGLFRKRVDYYRDLYAGNIELNLLAFDEKRAKKFIVREYGNTWLHVYENCIPWAMKSDIFRVLATYSLGGLYIDSKFAVKCVPKFVKEEPQKLHVCEWHDGGILNGIFYAPKKHALLADLMADIYSNITAPNRSNCVFSATGPAVWRRLLCDLPEGVNGPYTVKPGLVDLVSVFSKRAFFRHFGDHLDVENTRGTSEHWSVFQKSNPIFRDADIRK